MPDISLLEPAILRDVVNKMPAPENLLLSRRIPKTPTPFPVATWEVIRGSRTMATPNVPNSEAHIVPRLGISQESSTLVYLREKKVFQPTTLYWLKQPGSTTALRNAETEVLREVRDLNLRFDNFWEWSLWQAVQGRLVIDSPDVQADVDYKLPTSHKPTVAVPWRDADPTDIVANITAWKKLINRDGQVQANEAFATSDTMNLIVSAFTKNGITLMSDRMKDEYYSSGTLRGFMGLNWTVVDSVYDARNADGTFTTLGFLAYGMVIFGEFGANRPIELLQGPTADDEAPDGFIGRFAKTWKEKDPSARQYLIEEHALPIITRPEQFVVANVGALTA
jgi:hypothetical protein